jgi:hypothetical protein
VFDEGVEVALRVNMAEFDAGYSEWRCAGPLRSSPNLSRRDVDDARVRVNEPTDQPWAGDAVDLRSFAGDPFTLRRRLGRERQATRRPTGHAAVQMRRGEAAHPQGIRGLRTHAASVLATGNDLPTDLEFECPFSQPAGVADDRAMADSACGRVAQVDDQWPRGNRASGPVTNRQKKQRRPQLLLSRPRRWLSRAWTPII